MFELVSISLTECIAGIYSLRSLNFLYEKLINDIVIFGVGSPHFKSLSNLKLAAYFPPNRLNKNFER